MKTPLASVSKSQDPSWVRWLVTTADEAVWFYTSLAANQYAEYIKAGESDLAAKFAREHCCQ